MPKGIPLTTEEQNQRRHAVFHAAAQLFMEKGFHETSMQEIARAAGMGKSTLYDYFRSKDEILTAYVEDEIIDLAVLAEQIAHQELPAHEKLRRVMLAHFEYLMANKEIYARITYEVQRLKLESLQRIQAKRHAYQDFLCSLVEEAIHEGTFRPVNPLLAVRAIMTLLTPAVYTSRPTGTPEQMMNEAIDIFFRGVMRQP